MRAALLLLLALPFAALSQSAKGSTKGPSEGTGGGGGEGPVVRVAQGLLRGRRVDRSPGSALRTLYAFQGVPYARPPVGRRRFKDPEEVGAWTGVRNATDYGSICVQKILDTANVSGEEDCLYLNVFTAAPPESWARERRPVIVFIHGGAFVQWSGNADLARPDPLLRHGVVFVSLNYRLGVMGFLNTEDSQAPGNAGLKDQVLALRWVRRNIAAFGGDPRKVTIMGESAGAASVDFHMVSPLSRGLFHGAISVSGSALIPAARGMDMRRHALALRQRYSASCPEDAPDAIVSCLQKVDAQELVFNQYDLPLEEFQHYFLNNTFVPSLEKPGSSSAPFLTEDAEQLMREGRFERVPHMTGFTSAEGILGLAFGRLLIDQSQWGIFDDNFADIFRWEMPKGLTTREAALRMRRFYLGDRSLRDAPGDLDLLERFVQLLGDVSIALGTVNSARLMSDHGAPVYVYRFSRDGPLGLFKPALNATYIPGVTHGDDMVYLYDYTNTTTGEPLMPIPASEQPLRERQAIIFTNMAKCGNPTPEGSGLTAWPRYTASQPSFMDIDQELRVQSPALGERIAFWRQLASDQAEQQTTPEPFNDTSRVV